MGKGAGLSVCVHVHTCVHRHTHAHSLLNSPHGVEVDSLDQECRERETAHKAAEVCKDHENDSTGSWFSVSTVRPHIFWLPCPHVCPSRDPKLFGEGLSILGAS